MTNHHHRASLGGRRAVAMLLAALALLCQANAQNLVPNPSFEDLTFCPPDEAGLPLAHPWTPSLSPDLFSACSTNPYYGVPFNFGCNELPAKDGDSYIGMWSLTTFEHANTVLTEPLKAGKSYYARFYIAPPKHCWGDNIPHVLTDAFALGIRQDFNGGNYFPIADNAGNLLASPGTWTPVSGCYTARGGEQQIRLGNLRGNAGTTVSVDSVRFTNQPFFSYIFLDDVLLEEYNPFPDTLYLCSGQSLQLDASFREATYLWSTGSTSPLLQVQEPGLYAVQTSLGGCTLIDQVRVLSIDPDTQPNIDTVLCTDQALLVTSALPGTFRWSDGATARERTINTPGHYTLTVTNGCGEFVSSTKLEKVLCECRVFVPTAFSPNDDGINDRLDVFIDCDFDFEVKTFHIFDRWGNLVFSNDQLANSHWDGSTNTEQSPKDVYTWMLSYDLIHQGQRRPLIKKGELTIFK